jgi:hypothetical protein
MSEFRISIGPSGPVARWECILVGIVHGLLLIAVISTAVFMGCNDKKTDGERPVVRSEGVTR